MCVSDENNFYKGRLFGEVNSHVNAHIEEGLLTASIVTKDDSYHVEVLNLKIKHLLFILNWLFIYFFEAFMETSTECRQRVDDCL